MGRVSERPEHARCSRSSAMSLMSLSHDASVWSRRVVRAPSLTELTAATAATRSSSAAALTAIPPPSPQPISPMRERSMSGREHRKLTAATTSSACSWGTSRPRSPSLAPKPR